MSGGRDNYLLSRLPSVGVSARKLEARAAGHPDKAETKQKAKQKAKQMLQHGRIKIEPLPLSLSLWWLIWEGMLRK
jgi:hypothetical protein